MSLDKKFLEAQIIYEKKISDLEAKLADMEQEQIAEMKEHQEAMLIADKRIKELEQQLAQKEKEKNIVIDLLLDIFTKIRTEICHSEDTLSVHDNKVDVYLSYIRIQECLDIITNLEFDTKREINKLTHQHEDKGE